MLGKLIRNGSRGADASANGNPKADTGFEQNLQRGLAMFDKTAADVLRWAEGMRRAQGATPEEIAKFMAAAKHEIAERRAHVVIHAKMLRDLAQQPAQEK